MRRIPNSPALPSNGGLLNRQWAYTPAANTDIRRTFAAAAQRPLALPAPKGGVSATSAALDGQRVEKT